MIFISLFVSISIKWCRFTFSPCYVITKWRFQITGSVFSVETILDSFQDMWVAEYTDKRKQNKNTWLLNAIYFSKLNNLLFIYRQVIIPYT